ncbi:HK97 gp10 family phage protein [Peribacillus butanolivorans]|uniref:HK97 gp10 family phage protein n=1 Tax=Peribacillus butanolivorans TaxID=421767 RepID=UPI0035DD2E4B
MSVEFRGFEEIQKKLQEILSEQSLSRVQNKALTAGAHEVSKEISKEFVEFKDTGASQDEIVVGKVTSRNGFKSILVGWNGPKERYRLVHLNEFGYNRMGMKIKPSGYGSIQRAISNSEGAFLHAVTQEMKKQL